MTSVAPTTNLVANVSDVLASAADEAISEFAAAQPKPVTEEKPAQEPAATSPAEGDEEGTTDPEELDTEGEEGDAPAIPEGFTAVPAVTEGLATELTVRDADGDEVEVPALTIEYKANGKVRKDRIDQVVRLAQMGVYSQEREQKLNEREAAIEKASEPIAERLRLRETQLEQLLADEELYIEARERYIAANAPEQQVARLQAQLKEREAEMSRVQMATAAQHFTNSELVPALETIVQALPEVEMEELSNHLAVAMVPLMENGIVPPSRHQDIRNFVLNNLTDWAKRTHAARVQKYKAVTSEAETKVKEAQAVSQAAKNALGKASKPVARSAPTGAPRKATKTNPSVDDAIADATTDVLRSMGLS